ncbi:hypothetical protein [Leptothoe spongobia]|nr:hypothetical protein [Leptothoe spongobia]
MKILKVEHETGKVSEFAMHLELRSRDKSVVVAGLCARGIATS